MFKLGSTVKVEYLSLTWLDTSLQIMFKLELDIKYKNLSLAWLDSLVKPSSNSISSPNSSSIIVVSIVWYAIRIVSCVKISVSYRYIVSAHESYNTVCVSYESYHIVKSYVSYDTWTNALKWDFLLKFVLLF